LKLHGSTNWFYSGRNEYFGEPLRYRHPNGWSSDDLLAPHPELAGRLPLIVPPVTDKLGYFQNEAIQHLWAQASGALKNCRRVFLVGYSLPATDLTMRFLFNSRAQEKPIVFVPVNSSDKICSQIKRLFPRRNRIENFYVGKEAVKQLTTALRYDEMAQVQACVARTGSAGTVERLMRSKLPVGCWLRVAGRNEDFTIEAFCGTGLTILTGRAEVPILIRWECLETIVGQLGQMSSPMRVFGRYDPNRS
jgi:hypothetical protein